MPCYYYVRIPTNPPEYIPNSEGQTSASTMMSHAIFTDLAEMDIVSTSSSYCPMLSNVSACAVTEESDAFIVAVYNPLPRSAIVHLRLPTKRENLVEVSSSGSTTYLLDQCIKKTYKCEEQISQ